MTEQSWQWLGQPPAQWPSWLWDKTILRRENTLFVHLLSGTLQIEIGDWIENGPGRQVFVRKD